MHTSRIYRGARPSLWFETPSGLWRWRPLVRAAVFTAWAAVLLALLLFIQTASARLDSGSIADYLVPLLRAAAVSQALIAVLNLFLVPMMRWRDDMARIPLLIREVFQVHAWFISVTLSIFAALTWRFTEQLIGGNPLGSWLAAAIGAFWALRAVLQVTYYSASHWRHRPDRTLIHIALLLTYGGFAVVYLSAAVFGLQR